MTSSPAAPPSRTRNGPLRMGAGRRAAVDIPQRAGGAVRDRRGHPADHRHPRPRRRSGRLAPDGRRVPGLAAGRRVAARPGAPRLSPLAPGLTPEMVAAVSKIMRNQDLIAVAARAPTSPPRSGRPSACPDASRPGCSPTTRPTTRAGIAAATLDGLLLGCGDAVIGINPATDSPAATADLLYLLDDIRQRFDIPTQSCVLAHVTTTHGADRGRALRSTWCSSRSPAPRARTSAFGVDISLLREAQRAPAGRCSRGTVGNNVMYLETGQGSALSARARTSAPAVKPGGPADAGDPGVRGGAGSASRCWSTPSSASSARSTSTTASRSSGPGWRTTSAASCSACRWAWTSATPTTPKPTRTTWTPC